MNLGGEKINQQKIRLKFDIKTLNFTVKLSGCSSMVEQQPSKLNTWVRFPSPAPIPEIGNKQ